MLSGLRAILFGSKPAPPPVPEPARAVVPRAHARLEPAETRPRAGVPRLPPRPQTRLQHHSVPAHAERLLAWIRSNTDAATGAIHYADIKEMYGDMLIDAQWAPQPWVCVGRAFDLITTGGDKPYEWITHDNGRRQKVRVYPIPRAGQVAQPVPMARVA